MKPTIHAAAGTVAMLTVLTFWTSTAISELFLSREVVAAVKHFVLYGMLVLIPAMAITGASGFALGSKRKGRLVAGRAPGVVVSFTLRVKPPNWINAFENR